MLDKIKEEVFEVIEHANNSDLETYVAAGDYGVTEYCKGALKAKQNLIDLLSQHEKWDANRLAIIMPFYELRKPDWGNAGWEAEKMTYVLNTEERTVKSEEYKKFIYTFGIWFANKETNEISEENLKRYTEIYGNTSTIDALRVRVGQKVNKVIRKAVDCMIEHANFNNEDRKAEVKKEVERRYAAYSDHMKEKKIRRDVVISVHPADFLMMSNGVSWSSCHYLDGCHAAGTTSYALDNVSMILFTVNEGDAYNFTAGKINRQIYCYRDHQILQSRLYPNYENTELSTQFRNLVEKVICELTGDENLWVVRKNTSNFNIADNSDLHYPDYDYSSYNTRFCINKNYIEKEKELSKIYIGSNGCCLKCGNMLTDANSVLCYDCRDDGYRCPICGDWHSDADYMVEAYYEGDWQYVCERHIGYDVFYCEECDRYYEETDITRTEDGYWLCDSCMDEVAKYCESCGNYYHKDGSMNFYDVTREDGVTIEMCENCLNEKSVRYCEACGEHVITEDEVCPLCGVVFE